MNRVQYYELNSGMHFLPEDTSEAHHGFLVKLPIPCEPARAGFLVRRSPPPDGLDALILPVPRREERLLSISAIHLGWLVVVLP